MNEATIQSTRYLPLGRYVEFKMKGDYVGRALGIRQRAVVQEMAEKNEGLSRTMKWDFMSCSCHCHKC